MAKLTFGLEELVEILVLNELLPNKITRVKAENDEVHFVIKTELFIMPFIPASLKFVKFEDDLAVFEISLVGGKADKIISMFGQSLELNLPVFIKFDYPNIVIDIDKLFHEKHIKGVKVNDVFCEDGQITIVAGLD
jgi:hypothetical protein